ncbi:hypothetical protein ACIP9X_18560 [Arthrobacter sp. NPDC093125]|uniref:hypothetical protein n=1 Tax=Arthrobacter sp. NPDC093125 TaxID=3363944 RepID=UPI00381470C6
MVAELEAVPFRFRTLEGTAITKSKRQTPQNPTNLRPAKQRQLRAVHAACPHTQNELAEFFLAFPVLPPTESSNDQQQKNDI